MGIVFLIIILIILAVFFTRLFLNKELHKNAQTRVADVKKERIFWRLVNGYDGMIFDVHWIFTIYLDPRHLATFLTSSSFMEKGDKDAKIKKLISQKNFKNINVINNEIEQRQKQIKEHLDKAAISFTESEIKKEFISFKDDRIFVPEHYDKYESVYLRLLANKTPSAFEVWEARVKFEDVSSQFEWKSEEEKLDQESIFAVKKSQREIGEVVSNLLCKQIEHNAERDSLKNLLEEWEQLHMLRWCIVDYSANWIGTTGIERMMWRAAESVS